MTLKERVALCQRRRPKITPADIARAAGIKQPSVSDWFNGKTTRLKLKPAVKAAALWGCDPLWLGEGEGAPAWVDEPAGSQQPPAPELSQALPVVLDAIQASSARDELRQLLPLVVTGAPAYRQRLAELLAAKPDPAALAFVSRMNTTPTQPPVDGPVPAFSVKPPPSAGQSVRSNEADPPPSGEGNGEPPNAGAKKAPRP